MDFEEDRFLAQNKYIEEKLDSLIHVIESRLDKLYRKNEDAHYLFTDDSRKAITNPSSKAQNPYSSQTFATFKSPYIRDFRNFAPPLNEDVRQIQQLSGVDNVRNLVKTKNWTREHKQQLLEAVLDYYSKLHIIQLIKQKNQLLSSPSKEIDDDVAQKLRLIDEQMEQAKSKREPRIFVPEDRHDKRIDWCAISAKLSSSQHDARDCRLMWTNELHCLVNNDDWTKDEDICLINAVSKHGNNDWDRVAKELNNGRLAWQCCARYNSEYASTPLSFDKDETNKIIEIINLCRIGNFVPWNQVMYFIRHHNLAQIKYQWQKYCSEQRSTTNWTSSEDYLLLRAIERYGERDWCRVAKEVPGRTNKSCRERYMMRLKFQVRSVGSWHRMEDARLMSLVEKFGTNWSIISSHLSGRNCHQLRNRFELLKKETTRTGPVKHKKLLRNHKGEFVNARARRKRPQSEIAINERLRQIFSTYLSVNKGCAKTLTCRSAQDEVIYQTLVQVLCDMFLEREKERTLLESIINRAIDPRPGLMAPCIPTLRAYRAWSLQQDYLNQFSETGREREEEHEIDKQILKIVVSIFLWPAVLSRMRRPDVDFTKHQVGSMIERDSKNLYRLRSIQTQITR